MSYCAQCGTALPAGAAACPNCGQPAPGPAAAAETARKKNRTLVIVLVGCAVLVFGIAVLGIVAAIVIPNFLAAQQRAKQSRAVVELQTIGRSVEAYKAEHVFAPQASSMTGLAEALGTSSGAPIPRLDPWRHAYRYDCWREDPTARGCDHYRIASAGRDGRFDQLDLKSYTITSFDPTDYDRDIVFGDGTFIAWPERPRPPTQ